MSNLLSRYNKLKEKEKVLSIILFSVTSISICYLALYRPLSSNIRAHISQIEKLKTQLENVRSRYPKIDEEKMRVQELSAKSTRLLQEIEELENKLPSRKATARLIGELIGLAKNMEIESVRQKIDKGKEYARLFIELKFDASYADIVRYIKRVETISPFLKIEELQISEPGKKKKKAGPSSRLVISSLLGETPFSEQLKAKEISEEVSFEYRDVFVSKARPAGLIRKADIKLEGITYNTEASTCIINGEVLKEGSEVNGLTVKTILPDVVVLVDGIEDYALSVER